jgi:hypothetical protein
MSGLSPVTLGAAISAAQKLASLWEADGEEHVKPQGDKKIKPEIIDDFPDEDTLKRHSGFENRTSSTIEINSGTGVFTFTPTTPIFTPGRKFRLMFSKHFLPPG